jgi:hypothetical protein
MVKTIKRKAGNWYSRCAPHMGLQGGDAFGGIELPKVAADHSFLARLGHRRCFHAEAG